MYYDSLFMAVCRDCQETKLEESMKDKELQETNTKLSKMRLQNKAKQAKMSKMEEAKKGQAEEAEKVCVCVWYVS